jgi:response regulator of citrate/malate metabolism
LAILQEALAREATEEAADAAAHEAKRQAVLHYQQQLALMMAKEEADREELDAMILAAQRVQEGKQDAEWAAREQARRRLMAEVDAIRQQQIAAKGYAK